MRKQPNKQIRKYRGSNSYTAPLARFEYQIDIMDMKPLTKEPWTKIPIKNGEPRYGLVVIDIFSKLANVVPMKEKSGPITLSATKESFNKMGFPMSVYSDNDRAFQAGVKDFFDKEPKTSKASWTCLLFITSIGGKQGIPIFRTASVKRAAPAKKNKNQGP